MVASRLRLLFMGWVAVWIAGATVTPLSAATVDGRLDPDYGTALATQTNQTDLWDTPVEFAPGSLTLALGSELDALYAFVGQDRLHLFLSGNIRSYFGEPLMFSDQLEIFIDCAPGGQHQLRTDNPEVGGDVRLRDLGGLTFDAGFSPDYWFACAVFGPGPQPLFAYASDLPAATAGSGAWLGRTDGGSDGTLSGGVNPFAIRTSIDQRNRAGVTAGCGASSGDGVASGIEWEIPLAALGNPSGPLRLCAFITRVGVGVSNQVLGALPVGTCGVGAPGGVDFSGIPGPQYVTLDAPSPARRASWGSLKLRYR